MRNVLVLALVFALGACATYREDLNRGQRLYEENEYEHALAIWRCSRPTWTRSIDRSGSPHLRGMTDYRLGFRPDARHWLAIARAVEQEHQAGYRRNGAALDEALANEPRRVRRRRSCSADSVDCGGDDTATASARCQSSSRRRCRLSARQPLPGR
jgi:hypothetical protein